MLPEGLHVIGKVLPLIINGSGRGIALADIVTALRSIAIERKVRCRATGTGQTVTETGGKSKTFERLEVRIRRTAYVETAVLTDTIVTHNHRMVLLACKEF